VRATDEATSEASVIVAALGGDRFAIAGYVIVEISVDALASTN
jgi:hypothetical protein